MSSHTATPVATGLACPLCRTAAPPLIEDTLAAGGDWRCAVCHQLWNAQRLATVAGYEAFCAERAARTSAVRQSDAA
jgi:hypothetical protein